MRILPILVLALAACGAPPTPAPAQARTDTQTPPEREPEPEPAEPPLSLAEAVAAHPGELILHIDKSERELTVKKGSVDVRTYRVGLAPGIDDSNDKIREGDLATPEGDFRVVTRNDRSRFHLFLGISYPTREDADRGLRDGLITAAQARAIKEADAAGRVPPWNTPLGGMVGIHGGGGSSDWTLGCIAVENPEIEEVWSVAKLGTRVRIVD